MTILLSSADNRIFQMKKSMAFILMMSFSITSYSNDCTMHISMENKTANLVEAGLVIEGSKDVLKKMSLPKHSAGQFDDVCKGKYLVVFKDGEEYTETQPIEIKYDVIVEDGNTKTSWTNGSVEYFIVRGRTGGSRKTPKGKYKF